MDMESAFSSSQGGSQQPAADVAGGAAAGPKACATCRLAHVSCDREQPCGRCVRLGKAESCQPPPTRKRGRPPHKAPPPDDQPHHQPQPQQPHANTAAAAPAAAASKRVCVRPKTTHPAVVDPRDGVDGQPPHAAPAPAAGPQGFSSSIATTSPSSSSPAEAEEGWASSWSSPSPSISRAPSQPTGFAPPPPLPAPVAGHQGHEERKQDSHEGLRSLLMMVMDQVVEMRRENERLHDTIAQMRATQKQTECRLARVEADHEIKSRLLEQTRIELNNHIMTHSCDHHDVRDHTHTISSFPALPPFSASQATAAVAPPRLGFESQLVAAAAVAGPTTPRAEVEQFIAQTLPWLQEFDCSSLILRDLQRPFMVMRMREAETLDDLDTPAITYMSPSMCELLEYDMFELHGSHITSICSPRPEYLASFVRLALMRPATRVGKPFFLSREAMITKHGRKVHLSTTHQFLYNQRRLAQWHILQVNRVVETDLGSPSLVRPIPHFMKDPIVRAHLLARLPHSLLFGGQGEMATTPLPPHQVQQLTAEEAAALMAAMKQHHYELQRPPGRQDLMTPRAQGPDDANDAEDNDSELDELVRVLGLPIESGARASPLSRLAMTGSNWWRPPATTAATLAERWMR